jgi:hypothetical protein
MSESTASDRSGVARRGFLAFLASIPIVSLAASNPRRSTERSSVAGLGASPEAARLLRAGYPRPGYLPVGYAVQRSVTNAKSGFRFRDEQDRSRQLAFLAWKRGAQDPLHIFVTPASAMAPLFGTTGQPGRGEAVALCTGQCAAGVYHNGWWAKQYSSVQWETTRFHSLTFEHRGFRVAIRGSQAAGVDRHELLRIAEQMI